MCKKDHIRLLSDLEKHQYFVGNSYDKSARMTAVTALALAHILPHHCSDASLIKEGRGTEYLLGEMWTYLQEHVQRRMQVELLLLVQQPEKCVSD